MCRWMAWMGQSLLIDELLFKPQHGIVDQSLHSRMGAETTNGDGFGIGWYGDGEGPAVYHSVAPAWGDPNLRELAAHIESSLFLAHVRAAIGSPIQATNCHPFRRGRWLFVHNGYIADFHLLRRDLMLAVDPAQFAEIQGSTDSEVVFHLALTLGLESDPIGALEQTIGVVEATARKHGVAAPVQGTFGVSRRREPVGGPVRDRGPGAVALRLDRRRHPEGTASGERAAPACQGGRPRDRLRAVRRPPRGLAGDPPGDRGLGAPGRRAGGAPIRAPARAAGGRFTPSAGARRRVTTARGRFSHRHARAMSTSSDGAGSGRRIMRNAVSSPSRPARIGMSSATCRARGRVSVLMRMISSWISAG